MNSYSCIRISKLLPLSIQLAKNRSTNVLSLNGNLSGSGNTVARVL